MIYGRWIAAAVLALAIGLRAAPVKSAHVEAELVAERGAIQAGVPFTVALRMSMEPGWHTYWQNPGGEAGLPTTLAWTLPEGFTAGPIQWPAPERFEDALLPDEPPIVSYGFSDRIALLVEIQPPAELPAGGTVTLRLKARWLSCKTSCIPGSAELSLELPVVEGPVAPDPGAAELFAAARAAQPRPDGAWQLAASLEDGQVKLLVLPAEAGHEPGALTFIPEASGVIDDAAKQFTGPAGTGWLTSIPAVAATPPDRLRGVLRAEHGWGAGAPDTLLVDIPLAAELPNLGAEAPAPPAEPAASIRAILWAMVLAFLGGMVLNLMPCVLPVLSLKVMDFVEQAGHDPKRAWRHGLAFTAGVLASFLVLAGVVIALQAAGNSIGWGFQLQEPRFVFLLVAVLFVFGLSMFGVFECGMALTGIGSGGRPKGLTGSFFSGALATLVATPCTAPFMAYAVGFAFAQPPLVQILVFELLGLGMALPYLVLSSSPRLLKFVPRPGEWMESLKQFLGFLLMATVVWLLWVLGKQVGNDALGAVLMGLVGLAVGSWVLGRWASPVKSVRTRFLARVATLALLLAGLGVGYAGIVMLGERPAQSGVAAAGAIAWEPWDEGRIPGYRGAGRPVFVDFTADWCLTCKANERVAFRERVAARFAELNMVAMKADWTNRDETILKALEAHGRSGVPLYVYYPADPAREPVILPQILTQATVLEALAEP